MKERLTAHGVQSHQAAHEVVKVHVAVLIAIATDNQFEELVVEREACAHTHTHTHTHLVLNTVHTLNGVLGYLSTHTSVFLTCSLEGFRQLSIADHTWTIGIMGHINTLETINNKQINNTETHVRETTRSFILQRSRLLTLSYKCHRDVNSPAISWCCSTGIWTRGSPVSLCCRSEGSRVKGQTQKPEKNTSRKHSDVHENRCCCYWSYC